jgi:hypothetical protein
MELKLKVFPGLLSHGTGITARGRDKGPAGSGYRQVRIGKEADRRVSRAGYEFSRSTFFWTD